MSAFKQNPTLVAVIVAGAFFMEYIDGTVIATALPQMAYDFGTSAVALSIGMTIYLLTLAVFIPISGWTADRFGTRTVFGGAIVGFVGASVLCGESRGLWSFTAARFLQGIAGSMMVPVGRLVVLRVTEKRDLVRAIAYLTWPALIAPIIGPPLGGFITTYWSWHWIFFINVPIGAIGLLFTWRLVPNLFSSERKPFDTVGFFLCGGALSCLMYGMDRIGQSPTGMIPAFLFLGASAVLGYFAFRHVRDHPAPVIDLWPLRVPTFAATTWSGSIFRITINTAPFLLPLFFQVGFGLSAFASGLLVLATFAGNLSMKPLTTPLMRRFGFRGVLVWNGVATVITMAACCVLVPTTPRLAIMGVLFLGGLCRSMQFTAVSTLSYADIPQSRMSAASSFGSVIQQMALGLGVAVGALALHLARALHDNRSAPSIPDFHLAFAILAMFTLVGVIGFTYLDPNAGAEVSGHRVGAEGRAG
jgi:EmrB/QacA subfamily drug resistance transporter